MEVSFIISDNSISPMNIVSNDDKSNQTITRLTHQDIENIQSLKIAQDIENISDNTLEHCGIGKKYDYYSKSCRYSPWFIFLAIGLPILAIVILVIGIGIYIRLNKEKNLGEIRSGSLPRLNLGEIRSGSLPRKNFGRYS